jgi:hypothetical protein
MSVLSGSVEGTLDHIDRRAMEIITILIESTWGWVVLDSSAWNSIDMALRKVWASIATSARKYRRTAPRVDWESK